MKPLNIIKKIMMYIGMTALAITLGAQEAEVSAAGTTNISASYGSGKHTIKETKNWRYEVLSDKTIRIVGYKGNGETVRIPESISGRKVTKIGGLYLKVKDGLGFTERQYSLFYGKKTTSIIIPKSVTVIENKAFQGSKIKKVSISSKSNLVKIGDYAFEGSSLESITLPQKLTTIGKYSFSRTKLKTITIQDKVTKLSEGAFSKCKKLASVKLSTGLKKIENKTFMECIRLKKISLPEKTASIGEYAFAGTAFEWIYIPSKVKTIGNSAFAYNLKLKGIEIPSNVSSIGKNAFEGCATLRAADIKNQSIYIGDGAFSDTALTYVNIGSKVKTINRNVFSYDKKLKSIELGSNVTTIKYKAFYKCTALKNIIFSPKLRLVDGTAFDNTAWYSAQIDGLVYAGNVAYDYKGTNPTKITIKKGTIGIAAMAFADCIRLKNVIIPDGVKTIGAGAFLSEKSYIKRVEIPESVTYIGKMALGYKICPYDKEKIDSEEIYRMSSPYSSVAGEKIEGFIIAGKQGSVAEQYAEENGFVFETMY